MLYYVYCTHNNKYAHVNSPGHCVCVCERACVRVPCVRVRVLSGIIVKIIRSTYLNDVPVQRNSQKLASLCFKPLSKANKCHRFMFVLAVNIDCQLHVCAFLCLIIRGQGACIRGTVHAYVSTCRSVHVELTSATATTRE